MKFLDTNIILRYLTADDAQKAKRCEDVFKKAADGKETLYTTTLVIAEVVWVLEKIYKLSEGDIAKAIRQILNTPHIECDEKDILLRAVGLYELKKIDFIDVYNAVIMETQGIDTLYSYDTDFDSIPSLKRIEP